MSDSEKMYVGVAPLTMIRTKSGGYLNVYAGGVVPDDITDEDLERLLSEGFLGVVEVEVPAEPEPFDPEKGGNIPDTTAWVGADKVRAKQVLDIEEAKAEKDRRGSLVEKLQAVLAAE